MKFKERLFSIDYPTRVLIMGGFLLAGSMLLYLFYTCALTMYIMDIAVALVVIAAAHAAIVSIGRKKPDGYQRGLAVVLILVGLGGLTCLAYIVQAVRGV